MLPLTTGPRFWQPWRIVVGVTLAACVACITFVYRFNTLGGTLGGFDNDHFAQLMRTEMLLHGEQPLRDFADAELRGAWPALSYAVPAWAQQLGGRTLLSEAYLTIGALGLAYAIVFLCAMDLSKRWLVALLCAAVAVAAAPKLYNYSKVLMLAVGGLAVRVSAGKVGFWPLLFAAAATAAATLFRHDYGVYLAAGIVAGVVGGSVGRPSVAVRSCGVYIGLTAVLLLPSAIWVQSYTGIPTYLANALVSARLEAQRTSLEFQPFSIAGPLTDDALIALTYLTFWALVPIAAAVLYRRTLDDHAPRVVSAAFGTAVGLLAMTVTCNLFLLRANLTQRFGDAVVPLVLLASWTIGAAGSMSANRWRGVAYVPAGLLLFMLGGAYEYGDMAQKLDTAGFTQSWQDVKQRFASNRSDLLGLPPETWSDFDAEGPLVVARYVAECTAPDDYLLVAGYAPEVSVFARRRFAAGQGTVSLSLYKSEGDQRRALARLERQSVPIVLADAVPFEDEFTKDYPLLARYLAAHYQEAGTIANGDRRFLVFVDGKRTPIRRDPHLGLPCFQ